MAMLLGRASFLVMTMAMSSALHAADDPSPGGIPPRPTHFVGRIQIGAWAPRAGGTVTLGGAGTTMYVDTDLKLDDREWNPAVEVSLGYGSTLGFMLSGFEFSTDGEGQMPFAANYGSLQFSAGDRYRAELEIQSYALEAGWELWTPVHTDHAHLGLAPIVGGRMLDAEFLMEDGDGTREVGDGTWFGLYGGFGFSLDWHPPGATGMAPRNVHFDAMGAIGPMIGGDGGWIWQVRAGVSVEVLPHIELGFGYRLIEPEAEDGSFDFDTGLQGLVFFGAVTF